MLLHPDIQRRAQEEIEQVVGKCRIPDLSDREALPYVNAVLQETFRYVPLPPRQPPWFDAIDVSPLGGIRLFRWVRPSARRTKYVMHPITG